MAWELYMGLGMNVCEAKNEIARNRSVCVTRVTMRTTAALRRAGFVYATLPSGSIVLTSHGYAAQAGWRIVSRVAS